MQISATKNRFPSSKPGQVGFQVILKGLPCTMCAHGFLLLVHS